MKFALCTKVPHAVSLAVLDEGNDVLVQFEAQAHPGAW